MRNALSASCVAAVKGPQLPYPMKELGTIGAKRHLGSPRDVPNDCERGRKRTDEEERPILVVSDSCGAMSEHPNGPSSLCISLSLRTAQNWRAPIVHLGENRRGLPDLVIVLCM